MGIQNEQTGTTQKALNIGGEQPNPLLCLAVFTEVSSSKGVSKHP